MRSSQALTPIRGGWRLRTRFAEDGEAQGLRTALLGLLDWAAAMGGWEAEAWRIAERTAGRHEPDAAPRE